MGRVHALPARRAGLPVLTTRVRVNSVDNNTHGYRDPLQAGKEAGTEETGSKHQKAAGTPEFHWQAEEAACSIEFPRQAEN